MGARENTEVAFSRNYHEKGKKTYRQKYIEGHVKTHRHVQCGHAPLIPALGRQRQPGLHR